MKVRLNESRALFCDMGPHQGEFRIDITGSVYLTVDEYNRHEGFILIEREPGETATPPA